MPRTCETFESTTSDGTKVAAVMCFDRGRRKRCCVPDCGRLADYECDAPVASRTSGTCDKGICARHRCRMGSNVDYCPEHAIVRQPELIEAEL